MPIEIHNQSNLFEHHSKDVFLEVNFQSDNLEVNQRPDVPEVHFLLGQEGPPGTIGEFGVGYATVINEVLITGGAGDEIDGIELANSAFCQSEKVLLAQLTGLRGC